jgi:hypothetical protein
LLAIGLVPYLALRYPVVFGGVLPWGLLFVFRRWGFWRIVIALAGLAMFTGILIGRIRYGGFDFGASFFEALSTTGWLLLGGYLTYVLTRSIFGRHRLAYIGGAARREEYRASQRTETKRFRRWRDRKLNRAGKAVKEGDPYQGKHSRRRGRGAADPEPESVTVDARPAARPETFDPYVDGTTVDGEPISGAYQVGGGVRHPPWWRR